MKKIFLKKNKIAKKAKKFAKEKHKGQRRKFSKEPYFNHVKRVARNIKKYKKSHKSDELVATAFLHDTLENTNTSYKELEKNFGKLIASLVKELSNEDEKINKFGKKEYLAKKMSNSEKTSSWALCIKLSDRIDNISDLNKSNSKFREKYVDETEYIIKTLEEKRKLTNTQKNLIQDIKKILKKVK
jgi:guanosine-3',5'-bis(diphosphate) 3'-pyrophosphohydrolase